MVVIKRGGVPAALRPHEANGAGDRPQGTAFSSAVCRSGTGRGEGRSSGGFFLVLVIVLFRQGIGVRKWHDSILAEGAFQQRDWDYRLPVFSESTVATRHFSALPNKRL
jgi:hypothetical protein